MIIGECLFCKQTFKKRENKRKFCSLVCASNFNKNGLKNIALPPFSVELAEFIGICLGDGCVSGYQVSVTLNKNADKEYIPYVAHLMIRLFPSLKPSLIEKRKDNAVDVRVYSKVLVNFLESMGIVSNKKVIPSWIFSKVEYRYACIRGLFDTEGSISFKKYKNRNGVSLYKQLNFRNLDINFIRFVRDTLSSIGLKPTMTLKNSLYISNHGDIDTLREVIGFSNPKLKKRSRIYSFVGYQMLG
jgi:hypothetical protein